MILLNLETLRRLRSFDTHCVRWAVRSLGWGVFFCVLLGALAHGAEPPLPETGLPDADAPAAAATASASAEDAPPVLKAAAPEAAAAGTTGTALDDDIDSLAVDPGAAEEPAALPGSDTAAESAPAVDGGGEPTAEAAATAGDISLRAAVALKFWNMGQKETAERALADALSLPGPDRDKRDVLLTMADLYLQDGEAEKEISVRESFVRNFPKDPEAPSFLLRLGVLYRDAGAYPMAIARFYQVLNSTLLTTAQALDAGRRLAVKARLEIADTYLLQGSFSEARNYYEKVELLALEPADRERVKYRGAQLQYSLEQWQPAEQELGTFISEYPDSVFVPEARYMRARALKELQRRDEAVQVVLALLRSQDSPDPAAAQAAAYWKRRAGNELANNFFEQGDFLGALSIYQALARASADPAWRWPAIYQVGLCFERLQLPRRAAEAYGVILHPDPPLAANTALPETLTSLQSMAQWRLDHLDWVEGFGERMQVLSAGDPADA